MKVSDIWNTTNNGWTNIFAFGTKSAEFIGGGLFIILLTVNILIPLNSTLNILIKDALFSAASLFVVYEFTVLCILQNRSDILNLRPWLLLTIAFALNALSYILNAINDITGQSTNTIINMNNVFSVIFYPFIILGLLAFKRKNVNTLNKLQIFFDLGIIYISSFVILSLQFTNVLFSKTAFQSAAAQTIILGIVYSLLDLSGLCVILYISIRSISFTGRKGKEILFLGMLIFFAADIIDNYEMPRRIYTPGGIDEYMNLIAYTMFLIAAAYQISIIKNTGNKFIKFSKFLNFLKYFKLLIIYLPQICIILLIIYFMSHSYENNTINYIVGLSSIIAVLMISIVRQIFMTIEIKNVTDNLEDVVALRTKELSELLKQLEEKDLLATVRSFELKSSEERYRRLLENFKFGILIISKNKIHYINPRVLKFLCLKKDDLLGRDISALTDYVIPEHKFKANKLIEDARANASLQKALQVKIKNKEGVEFWIEIEVFPTEIDGEQMTQIVLEDITEKKIAENIIRTSEEKYRLLFEIQKSAIVLSDYDTGNIIDCNSAFLRLYGYTREELQEKSISDLAENPEEVIQSLGKDISEKPIVLLQRNHRKKDGTIFLVEVTKAIYYWRHRKVVVAVINDITERVNLENKQKELTENLRLLNENKNKFFSIIAHDLRNPFQGLLGFLEIFNSEYESLSENEKHYFINELLISVKNVYSLVDNLLLWSRMQSGKIEIKPENINVSIIVNEIIQALKFNLKNKEIELNNKIPDDISVYADTDSIKIVLSNMITNAIKFTPRKGKIFLEASTDNLQARISVRDTGIGIPSDLLPKIFDIGQRHSSPGTENEKGTGFGLSLCKELLEKNAGTIDVRSKPGEGTTFTIYFPVNKCEPENLPQIEAPAN